MKLILGLLTVLSLQAMACDMPQAQIIGTVQSVSKAKGICSFQINTSNFQMWNPSMICPLDFEDVAGRSIISANNAAAVCNLQPGQTVSGYLTLVNGVIAIEQ